MEVDKNITLQGVKPLHNNKVNSLPYKRYCNLISGCILLTRQNSDKCGVIQTIPNPTENWCCISYKDCRCTSCFTTLASKLLNGSFRTRGR